MEIMREAHAKLHGSLGAEQSYYFLSYRKALSQSGAGDGLDPKITEAIEKRHYEAMKIEMAVRVLMEQVIPPIGAEGPNRRGPGGVLPAVSWPWVSACGSLEPPRRDGENAQKRGKTGENGRDTA